MSDLPPPPPPPPPPTGGYGEVPAYGAPVYAEMGPRIVAFLIDYGIAFGGYVAVIILAGILGAIADPLGGLFGLLGMLAVVGYSAFYIPYMEGTTGQTIGKKTQGIKTVSSETGQPVGFAMAFVRYLVNGFCGLFWLLPFFDAQKQTVADKITKGITVPA